MTACRNKASRAVTAALVGVLSVGAVPMVALAQTEAAPMASVDEVSAFNDAKVTLSNVATVGGAYTETWDGTALKPLVSSVAPKGAPAGASINDVMTNNDYRVYYVKADAEGKPGTERVSALVDAGTYYVVVEAVDGDYAGGKATVKVTITGQSLAGASAFTGNTPVDSTSNPAEYDAEPIDLSFKLGGTELVEGVDYTVRYYESGEDMANPANGSDEAPTDAGTYFAKLSGLGKYAGKSESVSFKIDPCNLYSAKYTVPVTVGATGILPTAPGTVNGSEALAKKVMISYSGEVDGLGAYPGTVKPVDENDPNFARNSSTNQVNTGSVTAYRVEQAVKITYDGKELPESMSVIIGKGEVDFSKLKVTYVDANGDEKPVSRDMNVSDGIAAGQYGITVVDTATNAVLANNGEINTVSGSYKVMIEVTPVSPWTYGGSATFGVTTNKGTIDCAESLYVSYTEDGTNYKVVSSVEKDYDGKDIAGSFKVNLYNGKNALTPGTDFDCHFEDAEGNKVSQVKDAGSYKLVVTSDDYALENNTFDITINKADIQAIRILVDGVDDNVDGATGETLKAIDGQYAIPYTGNVLSPRFVYTTGERDDDGELEWHWLYKTGDKVAAATDLSYTKDGKDVNVVKEAGDYVATLTLLGTDEAKNFELSAKPYEFSVVDKVGTFVDVPADAYYFGSVEQAFKNHYIYGYNNGDIFGPTDSMSRADVAVVLYRMSGSQIHGDNEGAYTEQFGWNTGYEDVDGKAYYAEAVAWARKAGIVAGLDETHFGPTQKVTREQFATMLANYAKARGDFEAADESVLDGYADADQISAFARGTVAWAVEEGVMGGSANLMPTNEVTRADVAVMAVNYQPAPLAKPVA